MAKPEVLQIERLDVTEANWICRNSDVILEWLKQ